MQGVCIEVRRIIYILLLLFLVLSCSRDSKSAKEIIAIDFPSYDVARTLLEDDSRIALLLPPGSESHHYEPTPKDMIALSKAKLVIYTGGESEEWVDSVLESMDKTIPTFKLIDSVELLVDEEKEGMSLRRHNHDEEEIDEHVWTSIENEISIAKALSDVLMDIYDDSSDTIESNRDRYISELKELDSRIRNVVENAKHDTLIFASRFPFRYFVEEYGLDYYAAFPGCAEETEPSASTIAFLIGRIKELGIGYVLDIEFGSPLMAKVIAQECGIEVRRLNSMHNITRDAFLSGANYISIMEENLKVLEEVLN